MEPGRKVRVLLVDDNFMVRQTMRDILQPYADIEVVGEASDGDEAIACVGMLQPVLYRDGYEYAQDGRYPRHAVD